MGNQMAAWTSCYCLTPLNRAYHSTNVQTLRSFKSNLTAYIKSHECYEYSVSNALVVLVNDRIAWFNICCCCASRQLNDAV